MGGETAELPDQLSTIDVSAAMFGIVELSRIVSAERIAPGDRIIGIRSGGRTIYERRENSGIMCNGLTLARRCLLSREYSERYPEIIGFSGKPYSGRFRVDDYIDELNMTVGEALLSPTRIFAPIVFKLLERFDTGIKAMIHNTGGGLTKCVRVGRGVHYIKDNLPKPDPIFELIQREAKEDWKSMYQTFNMGIGFEIIVAPEIIDDVMSVIEKFGVEAKVIGFCEKSNINRVTLQTPYGRFEYAE